MLPNYHFLGFELNWYSFFPCLGLFTTIFFGLWYIRKNVNIRLSVIQTLLFFFVLYILLMTGGRIVGAIENYLKVGSFPDISVFFCSPFSGKIQMVWQPVNGLNFSTCHLKKATQNTKLQCLFRYAST